MVVWLERSKWIKTNYYQDSACRDLSLKAKCGLFVSGSCYKKEAHVSWTFLDFVDIPHLAVLLWPIYRVTWKAASFNWGRTKERLCGSSRLLGQLLCPGAVRSAHPAVHKVAVADGDDVWSPWRAPTGQVVHSPPRTSEQGPAILYR